MNLKRNTNPRRDIEMLRDLMPTLSADGAKAIYLRFWEHLLISEIAQILKLSWSETDRLIEDSIKQLRQGFVEKEMDPQPEAA